MTDSLDALVTRVAKNTIERDMESEDWEKAVALNGLLAVDDEKYAGAVRGLVDRSIETQTCNGQFAYGSLGTNKEWSFRERTPWAWVPDVDNRKGISDPTAVGHSVVDLYDRTGEDRYLDAAHKQYNFLQSVDRIGGSGIPHHRGGNELWVDGIYMIVPFLARYGAIADEPEAFDEVERQISVQSKYLQSERTDLFRHIWCAHPDSYPQSTFWSRGNGWAGAGMVDALEYLPEEHPSRDTIVDVLSPLAEALVGDQDPNGFWHNIIDNHESVYETSGTLMHAYTFKRALDLGVLDEEKYERAAQSAMEVCKGVVDADGNVRRVSIPPGGPGPTLGVTSYGQGWFLLAASCFL